MAVAFRLCAFTVLGLLVAASATTGQPPPPGPNWVWVNGRWVETGGIKPPKAPSVSPVDLLSAARFLDQATFGPSPDDLAAVRANGPEAWLEQQLELPPTPIPDGLDVNQLRAQVYLNMATAPDQLRQRVAFALSQIVVVSARKNNRGEELIPWVRLLTQHAFGNYRSQLKEVARFINIRSHEGPGRQVFFCSMDGYDLHSGQAWNHWYLLSSLSQALAAFDQAIEAAGLSSQVTTFTQSEFSRTLQPSGSGSDHAWGAHHIVAGGAVKGGIYGALPTLALGGPDDAGTRGVWIPTISTSQFGATLGRWVGASPAQLEWAFPNLARFAVKDLGFV